jgi:mRNA interferase HicA
LKRSKFVKYLNAHRCILLREGKKHTVVMNMDTHKQTTLPRHANIEFGTMMSICKVLEIPAPREK